MSTHTKEECQLEKYIEFHGGVRLPRVSPGEQLAQVQVSFLQLVVQLVEAMVVRANSFTPLGCGVMTVEITDSENINEAAHSVGVLST